MKQERGKYVCQEINNLLCLRFDINCKYNTIAR